MSEDNCLATPITHDQCMSNDALFSRIDEHGGWPLGFRFLTMHHDGPGNGRRCIFNNQYRRTEWWTTVCEASDYYWWKISPEAKQKFIERSFKARVVVDINPTNSKVDDFEYKKR